MRWRPFTWLLVSVFCFVAAVYFWRLGDQWAAKKALAPPPHPTNQPGPVVAPPKATSSLTPHASRLTPHASSLTPRLAHRLSNTTKTVGQLARSDRAILLENLLLDTGQPAALSIPAHLRAQGDPGSYIVQSRAPLDDAFRALLQAAGASIISYIPNNAYLVRASAAAAQQLEALPQTQTVLPFEPYYKLKPSLLKLAVDQTPLPQNTALNLLLFADARETTLADLNKLGVEIIGQDRSPFGPVLKVRPPADGLPALAGLPGVHELEPSRARVRANDLSRQTIGVADDSVTMANYLGLTGANVLVNINDTGVDLNHPDLAGRVFVDVAGSGVDTDGHGTHVAGIIASSGGQSLTVTNAEGSIMPPTNAQFRGMAPAATIFAMSADLTFGPATTDTYLQETAARTNAFISNNSWHFFSDNEYDLGAASYDAAVRDALPLAPGSQPVLFVFAAGNSGNGDNNGTQGTPDTIQSPATAKNVITVGAIELPRNITNDVWKCSSNGSTNGSPSCITNKPWQQLTDADDQVAGFSSRGNVGIAIEGDFGRFKPDLVAPGTFVVSTRSTQWDQQAYYNPTSHLFNAFSDLVLDTNSLFNNSLFIPDDAVQATIQVSPNALSTFPFPDLTIYVKQSDIPTPTSFDFKKLNVVTMPPDASLSPRGVDWFYTVANYSTQQVTFDLLTDITVTNDLGNYLQVLSNMNNSLGPFYRYESGTSMAAADVSGTLALMQEFFQKRLSRTPSPALMKAMLINGARSAGVLYSLQVTGSINFQGWGRPGLQTSLPGVLTNNGASDSSMFIFDQSPTNALATGQSRTYNIRVANAARAVPLRVTLVWTDPPGNPLASTKLVNDLDLIVTNFDNPDPAQQDVFFGNDITAGNDFNLPWDTNSIPNLDVINNVENIYLSPDLGTNYSITVTGRRVNVNAVTTQTNDVTQDFALVISSGDGEVADGLTLTASSFTATTQPLVTLVTNSFGADPTDVGGILQNQHVGANTPLLGTDAIPWAGSTNAQITLGMTNQWHFYVVTNNTTFTNAAFLTFVPPTLGLPRMGVREGSTERATRAEADIDLYVSLDPDLTNLAPLAVAAADKSLGRGGTETIVYSNASPGTFYIGIKSEDQQAAEYGFLGVLSQLPFGEIDSQGNQTLRGFPAPAPIPDGTPANPGVANVFAICFPMTVRRAVVTNCITHQLMGDLLGTLVNKKDFAVLNNHAPETGVTNQCYIYDDSGESDKPYARHTDGPGSLHNFAGKKVDPQWHLTEVDNAANHTGTNLAMTVWLEKQQDLTNGIIVTLPPGGCIEEFVDVPIEATNLTITVGYISGADPVGIQICPLGASGSDCLTNVLNFPGGTNTIDKTSNPPLNLGTYVVRLCNNINPSGPVTLNLRAIIGLDITGIVPIQHASTSATPLLDDAVSYSSIFVSDVQKIASVEVGLRVDHPRVSDLVFHLIAPSGDRLLLCENRGGVSTDGMGYDLTVTNSFQPVSSSGGAAASTNIIDTGRTSGTIGISYNFYQIPDTMHIYYESNLIFDSGLINGTGATNISYGPGNSTLITIIMNQGGNFDTNTLWDYRVTSTVAEYVYLTFTENANETVTPIKFAIPPLTVPNYTGSNTALTNGIFYLPEEPLDPLVGQFAHGEWTLEIWDDRAGATNFMPTLLGWQLQFVYQTSRPAPIPLTTGVTQTNTVGPGQIQYFTVDVPNWASFATNLLLTATGPVNLLFNQNTPPTGTNVGDFNLLTGMTSGANTLQTNGAPPLVPGARYYLGVQNPGVTPVTFAIEVDFDITPLTNGIALTSTLANGPLQRYFYYDVSTNATAVSFQLLDLSGNVNLVAQKAPSLPTLGTFSYGSFNPGTNSEAITIFTNSDPVPLTPGRWFLGVFNADVTNVTYTILATEYTNAFPNIITLYNRVPYPNTNSGAGTATDFYRFVVSTNAVGAQFEIDNPSADMTLVARKGLPLPTLASYDLISASPGITNEVILFYNYSSPVPLTPGEWFISAVNVSGAPAAYTIMASEITSYGPPVIKSVSITSNSFCITWTSVPGLFYFVQGKTNLTSANWDTITATITATGPLTTYCIPLPSPYQFFRVGQGLSSIGFPPVRITSITRSTNGVLLQWTAAANSRFNVQWTPALAPPAWNTFTNLVTSTNTFYSFLDDGSQSGGLGPPRFYRLLQLP